MKSSPVSAVSDLSDSKEIGMIDDYERAMKLVQKMKAQLPISAQPTAKMRRALRDQGKRIVRDQELQIQDVFYAGDEGGIMCGMTMLEGTKEAIVVSLTHLRVDLHHPLAEEIRAYQKERKKRLAQSGRPGRPSSFTLRPRKRR